MIAFSLEFHIIFKYPYAKKRYFRKNALFANVDRTNVKVKNRERREMREADIETNLRNIILIEIFIE